MHVPQLAAGPPVARATVAAGNATAAELSRAHRWRHRGVAACVHRRLCRGHAYVELARTPDVLTADDRAGAFIEPVRDNFMFVRPPFIAAWGLAPTLNAGTHYWQAKAKGYATEAERGFVTPWTPVRVLRVRDEPPIVEGWTLRARRATRAGCARRYRRAYLLSGTIAWQDNSEPATAGYTLTLSHAGGGRVRLTGSLVRRGDGSRTGSART